LDWLEKEEEGIEKKQVTHDFYCNCAECLERIYGKPQHSETKNINVKMNIKNGKSVRTKDSDNNISELGSDKLSTDIIKNPLTSYLVQNTQYSQYSNLNY